jgi:hypothetical protein
MVVTASDVGKVDELLTLGIEGKEKLLALLNPRMNFDMLATQQSSHRQSRRKITSCLIHNP